MPLISNSSLCCTVAAGVVNSSERTARFPYNFWRNSKVASPILRFSENDKFGVSRLALSHSRREVKERTVSMALVSDTLGQKGDVASSSSILAYDLIQGELVRWSSVMDRSIPDPPTAVFLHGILGCRKNWGTFARRLAREFTTWQFLLVDLRCHGDSASIKRRGPHSVASAAIDVLKLVRELRITPRVLVGHSFGGKVVLSMVDQAAKPLARPVRAENHFLRGEPWFYSWLGFWMRHPEKFNQAEVEKTTQQNSFPFLVPCQRRKVPSKQDVVKALIQQGFSNDVAQWVVTNLRPTNSSGSQSSSFSWVFDLKGIAEMYQSYEETNLWKIVEDVPRGVHMNFLKAERSLHRWALEDLQRIHAAEELAAEEGGGVEMHVLEDAGHWVHADNPDGLFRMLSSSFQGSKT
ncbi:abhydrolase domain-containing protein C22H12.03 isoform X1 [Abrus precatorius]|uniref:Abhydrolase domain-containing protein C22H12.03 isoform X1 n=1 Tax=Abrus precatorius TaxID=3816 RepID=A0A8B8LZ85_ABRPR|nr:abhydrolase domain-containing protein C22H12.03 isoform X1 [Abrus precatorius]